MATLDTNSIRAQINKKSISNKDLLAIYRRVAKMADQRLVRLEALEGQKNFKKVTKYAYKKATIDAMMWGANPEKPRFNIKPPVNTNARGNLEDMLNRTSTRAKINDILNFLEKPTSTKAGIIGIYQKRADSLNKNTAVIEAGLHFTWQDVGDFFESRLYKKMLGGFGSETNIKSIGILKDNEVKLLEAFKADKDNHIKTADTRSATYKLTQQMAEGQNIVVAEAIKKATADYAPSVRTMLKIV